MFWFGGVQLIALVLPAGVVARFETPMVGALVFVIVLLALTVAALYRASPLARLAIALDNASPQFPGDGNAYWHVMVAPRNGRRTEIAACRGRVTSLHKWGDGEWSLVPNANTPAPLKWALVPWKGGDEDDQREAVDNYGRRLDLIKHTPGECEVLIGSNRYARGHDGLRLTPGRYRLGVEVDAPGVGPTSRVFEVRLDDAGEVQVEEVSA